MNLKAFGFQALVLGLLLTVWQLLPMEGIVSPQILSPLYTTLINFPKIFARNGLIPGGLIPQLLTTLEELGVAFVMSIAVSIVLGFLFGYFKVLGRSYEPLIYLVYAVPGSIYYPVLFLTLGLGVQSKIAMGFLFGVFPPLINILSGFRKINGIYISMARSMGSSNVQLFTKVVVPSLAPYIMAGIRLALIFTYIGVILGEVIASKGGLGWAISIANYNFNAPLMYDYIIVVVLLAVAFLVAITAVERRVFSYA